MQQEQGPYSSGQQVLPPLLAMLLLSISWVGGPGLTSDSYLYLEGARHLQTQGFHQLFDQLAFRAKPPGFSLYLWLIGSNQTVFMLGQTLCIGLSTYLAGRWLDRRWRLPAWSLWAKVLLASATPMLLVHHFLWTEGLFVLLLLCYWRLLSDQKEGMSLARLVLIASCGLALVSIKHIAMVWVVAASSWLLLQGRWRAAAAQGLPPLLAFVAWQWVLDTTAPEMQRMDYISGVNLWSNLSTYASGIADWFLPRAASVPGLSLSITGLFFAAVAWAGFRSKSALGSEAGLLALSMMLYAGAMLPKGILELGDVERYLSLIVIPALLLGSHYLNWLRGLSPKGQKTALLLAWLWLLYPLSRSLYNLSFWAGWH